MDQKTVHTTGIAAADIADEGFGDSLVDALEIVAGIHRKPFSRAAVLAGLPLADGRLDLKNFPDAAGRIGLDAKTVRKLPSRVPGLVCPFVALCMDGSAIVVTRRNARRRMLEIQVPGAPARQDVSEGELDTLSAGLAIYVADREQQKTVSGGTLEAGLRGHWLWSVAARFWPSWLHVILAAFFINLLGLALPLFVMNVYDRVIPNNSIPTLWALAAGVVIALGFDFVLRMVRAVVIDQSGRRIDMKVSAELFRQALDARMSQRTMRSGELASHVREFENVRDFFTSSSITSVIDLCFIGVFLGVLWLIVGELALVPLLAVPIVLLATLLIQIPLARSVNQAHNTTANRQTVLVESLVGIETVKAISAEGSLQRKWENAVAGSVRGSSSIRFWSALAMYFSMFVQQGVSVVIIVWGVFLVAAGDITIGALIASNILAGRVLAPLGSIAMTLSRAQQSFTSLRHLNALMHLDRDHVPLDHDAGGVESGALQLRELSFTYPSQNVKALEELSLSINPGERVGIVGRIGSGKSTLGKLLCGLYEPDEGAVILDGKDVRHLPMADLRRHVIYVGQEADLFSGSVKENILIANPVAPAERFEECAVASGVAGFAQTHPLGYAMPVGERGRAISGGQRQSIALARAMIAEPDVLFLDEPSSAMDNLSEAALVRNIKGWLKPGMTLIVSTHRGSLLDLVDRLIVLEHGKLAADGPKEKVLELLGSRTPATGVARAAARQPAKAGARSPASASKGGRDDR